MLVSLLWILEQTEDFIDNELAGIVRAIECYSSGELRRSKKRILAWGPAERVWRREKLGPLKPDFLGAEASEPKLSPEEISEIFDRDGDKVLITGLDDVDGVTVRILWEEARKRGIPVVALADNDKNIAARLFDSKKNVFLPDRLLVPSLACIEDIERNGLDSGFAVLCRNCHLFRMEVSPAIFKDCRKTWGAVSDETVVLFVSLVGREMSGFGRPVLFDEVVMLEKVVSALDSGRIEENSGPKIKKPRLVVRPHPRENTEKFDWLTQHQCSFPIVLSDAGSPTDAIMSADIVVGVPCAMLEEAQVRGQTVHFLTSNGID